MFARTFLDMYHAEYYADGLRAGARLSRDKVEVHIEYRKDTDDWKVWLEVKEIADAQVS